MMDTQTTSLLVIHLGPVQDWIAQARRTRDAWFGSHYLSEVSKAAAKRLLELGAELIFPYQSDRLELTESLKPSDTPWYERYDDAPVTERRSSPAFNVANKIVVVVKGDPRAFALAAREAARARWEDIVNRTLHSRRCKDVLLENNQPLIDEQRDTLLEYYAVWATLPESRYGEVFAQLNRTLNARKQVREFQPWHFDNPGEARSSLDGARASVLKRPRTSSSSGGIGNSGSKRLLKARARLRIEQGEHLDAVGLTKRAGGGPEQFVPLVNVARAVWIQQANEDHPKALQALKRACWQLEEHNHEGLGRVVRPDLKWTNHFPFDAHLFSEERWEKLFEEMMLRVDEESLLQNEAHFRPWCEEYVRPLLKRMPAPPQYVACLVADGDRMGEALSRLNLPEQHRIFSEELSRFAREARRIVEQEFAGSLVFSGGDDVFGWLPVPNALECAAKLRETFARIMQDAVRRALELNSHAQSSANFPLPTLSVGIGIGHVMESMGTLINLGREAELEAKGNTLPTLNQRNAVAVILDKRSGGRVSWRTQWHENPLNRLTEDRQLLSSGVLSIGKIHELRGMLERLPLPDGSDAAQLTTLHTVLSLELRRILGRNEGRGGLSKQGISPEALDISPTIQNTYRALFACVTQTLSRLLIAVELAGPMEQKDKPPQTDGVATTTHSPSQVLAQAGGEV